MKPKTPYKPFETFVFRTPAISLEHFHTKLNELEHDVFWNGFLQDTCIQESIFLGSPVLFEEIQKFIHGDIKNEKEINRIKLSVLRYYTRMSSRCTPFGLFAGFSLGRLGNETNVCLKTSENHVRYTRLDMHYLCNLAQTISKHEKIKESLLYYPNTSLYKIADKMRYVEWYFKNSKRIHQISAVDYSDYIALILMKAKSGALIEELANSIIDEDITYEEGKEFIYSLIDAQILVSELEPSITGKDFFVQIINVLQKIDLGNDILKNRLSEISQLLNRLDNSPTGTALGIYKEIEKIIKEINIPYEQKYLFQTDMYKPVEKAVIDRQIVENITETLCLMNKITLPFRGTTTLAKFAENYYQRYEEREMPLLLVLDTESGIGYPVNSGDINSLLDDLMLPYNMSEQDIKWNRIESILHKKLMDANKTNAYSIEIQEKDFEFLKANWNDLPVTFSCMCELFTINQDHTLLYILNAGGSCAGNILGRFCHITKELEEYVCSITEYEQQQNLNVIYAEIVHLPESRIGNILLRPILRPYEIPYLAQSSVGEEYQIPATDLYISVKQNNIILRSKSLNKQIIPRLTTAHNFSFNSMPVYHFLCDMQTQGLRPGVGFHFGSLANEYDFLPRAVYKNVILSLAEWKINTKEFNVLIENKDKNALIETIHKWRLEKQIPRYVTLADGDNELLIDFESCLSIQMLYSVVKKRIVFKLQEFLFDETKALVKDKAGNSFTNEFIFGFYKTSENE
jgi:hypothetical protein